MVILNKNSAINPETPVMEDEISAKKSMDKMLPAIIPLRANCLDGIKGSSNGVTNAPEMIPETSATKQVMPLSQAPVKEKIPGPNPERMKRMSAVISAGFITI